METPPKLRTTDLSLFTRTASEFVGGTDSQIEEENYVRGELFVRAAKCFVRPERLEQVATPCRLLRAIMQ
jgi:hypothetical protein